MTKQVFQAGSRFFLPAGLVLAVILSSCALPKGVYHRVDRGQTLYRICKTYQVEEDTVARINRIRDRSSLQVGQRLFIPGASRIQYVPPTADSGTTALTGGSKSWSGGGRATAGKGTKPLTANTKPAKTGSSPVSSAGTAAKPPLPANAKGKFAWPVRGDIVRHFGEKSSAVSKGVEIAVPFGSSVRAAAAGKVTYSGNGIKGYGNLVILKHDGSFFTVYGFNEKTLVRTGQYVSREQRIALSGTPPGGGTPRLHFEIRRGKDALNPLYLLP